MLAGILSFTDKVINEGTRQYIKVIGMTQVGKMLSRGDSLEDVAEILELPEETVKAWMEKAYTMV